ncbi:MAG: transposase [Gammaproteobacteria bacterium]|nr:transposase [Gammaproteobacteria bacterium]
MGRPLRVHAAGAIYHVTLRGNHRAAIFDTPQDYAALDGLAFDVLTGGGARAHAYCWMPNHLHLLLQVQDESASHLMRDLAGRYSRYLQERRETTGQLFDRRFFSQPVTSDRYLVAAARYIHLNPVRAGLAASAGDYPWSGHRAYLGGQVPAWVATRLVLGILGAERTAAVAAYRRLTEGAEAVAAKSPFGYHGGRTPAVEPPSGGWASLDQVIEAVCEAYGISRGELASRSRPPQAVADARLRIALAASASQLGSLRDVARAVGCSHAALSQALARHPGW